MTVTGQTDDTAVCNCGCATSANPTVSEQSNSTASDCGCG